MRLQVHVGGTEFQYDEMTSLSQKISAIVQIDIQKMTIERPDAQTVILKSRELKASHIPVFASQRLIAVILPVLPSEVQQEIWLLEGFLYSNKHALENSIRFPDTHPAYREHVESFLLMIEPELSQANRVHQTALSAWRTKTKNRNAVDSEKEQIDHAYYEALEAIDATYGARFGEIRRFKVELEMSTKN